MKLMPLNLLAAVLIGCVITAFITGCGATTANRAPSATVFLVRHGEAYKNVPHPDDMSPEKLDSLTDHGRAQAQVVGDALANSGVCFIYVSPTHRTRETGDLIAERAHVTAMSVTTPALAPLAEGKTPEGAISSWDWRVNQWKAGMDARPEGGESLADGEHRAMDLIETVAREHPGTVVVIVTHGDICSALLGRAAGTPVIERPEKNTMAPGSCQRIEIRGAHWLVTSVVQK